MMPSPTLMTLRSGVTSYQPLRIPNQMKRMLQIITSTPDTICRTRPTSTRVVLSFLLGICVSNTVRGAIFLGIFCYYCLAMKDSPSLLLLFARWIMSCFKKFLIYYYRYKRRFPSILHDLQMSRTGLT